MTRQSRLSAIMNEQRAVKLDSRAIDVASRSFQGHAAVYNQRTAIGNPLQWGFYELVAPTAFDKSLRDGDVVMLADHDMAKPLARMSAGTLQLASDATGLDTRATIPALSYGDDLIENLRIGNVAGMSFGFQTLQDDWTTEQVETNDGQTADVEVRTLLEVRLIEVSTTAFPAYAGTDAGLRSIRAAHQSRRARNGAVVSLAGLTLPPGVSGGLRVGATISAATASVLSQVQDNVTAGDDDSLQAALDLLDQLVGDPAGVAGDEDGDDIVGENMSGGNDTNGAVGDGSTITGDTSANYGTEVLATEHADEVRRRKATLRAQMLGL